jgi:hypothetical protein
MEENKSENISIFKIVLGLIFISVYAVSIYKTSFEVTNTLGLIWGLILLTQSNIFHRIETSNWGITQKKRSLVIWILLFLVLILFIRNNFI